MERKVVVHMKDGSIHKGITHDFESGGESFHLLPAEGGGIPMLMRVSEMKALFWVKDFLGIRRGRFREQAAGLRGAPRDRIPRRRLREDCTRT